MRRDQQKRKMADGGMELRLLGPFEVWREGERVALPRSKKTRALLAYLVATERTHRRDRLCEMFWDVADDRRGALRWSLSKIRRLVNDGEVDRIDATREEVAFVTSSARVDILDLQAMARSPFADADTAELERLAGLVRGEFLEGLELPDFLDFQAWCTAMRESAREAHCQVLAVLAQRHAHDPLRALEYARTRAQADVLGVEARVALMSILLRLERKAEARQQFEMGTRLLQEVGAPGVAQLESAWAELTSATTAVIPPIAPRPVQPVAIEIGPQRSFVGRSAEREVLASLLERTRQAGQQSLMLITGEPGAGKSSLLGVLADYAASRGIVVHRGRAYEAEGSRPYGPWVDALGGELSDVLSEASGQGLPSSRDALFNVVAEATAAACANGPALLVFDDIQWIDPDSAELLHFVLRSTRERPVCVVLSARAGELADNDAMLRTLRGLRREGGFEELELAPMTSAEIAELIAPYEGLDGELIREACAGNPLYAIELARAGVSATIEAPRTVVQLVRERVDRLPAQAAEVLRWCAVLGHEPELARLEKLSSLSLEELVEALERLEQHALLRLERSTSGEGYRFAHDLIREAVYSELSFARRRLMHLRVAKLLEPEASNAAIANQIAHHASIAGDAALGAKACVVAGQRSLRVFANGDAETLAKRGLALASELDDGERIAATLELLYVQFAARTPDRQKAAAQVHDLAEKALDLGLTRAARLGFQMLSFLRWESSSMLDAHRNIMQAERVSRSADPSERTVALAQAARCLVLLERNMNQAEAFVLEADALASRAGNPTSAVCFASAMLHAHRGETDEAANGLREARQLARAQGDRLAEFRAVEHRVMLELDRREWGVAAELARELAELGERLREGVEGISGRALHALTRVFLDEAGSDEALAVALEELRAADSKYELAYVMTRLARVQLERGDLEGASASAGDGLALATAINRASEIALARLVAMRCAEERGEQGAADEQRAALLELRSCEMSDGVRALVAQAVGEG